MEIILDPSSCRPPSSGSAVTIGAYDGVHRGHQALLAGLRAEARTRGLETVVVTFDRHPATVVRPESAPLLLCDLDQKLELLAAQGVDRTVVVPFDAERAKESPEDFVSSLLVNGLAARLIVVGEDFHFGRDRAGNVALLRAMGETSGFTVEGIDLVSAVGGHRLDQPISSTFVRQLVGAGEVAKAAVMLGRPHQIRGEVVHGDRRGGAELGYPTANLEIPPGMCLPALGIYAGFYERPDGTVHPTAISVGRRPTFYENGDVLIEAFLLDASFDLYGEAARVSFVERLRSEVAFDSVDDLVAQMAKDVESTRVALGLLA